MNHDANPVDVARNARLLILKAIAEAHAGHVGGSLSAAEILAVLFFRVLNVRPSDPTWEERDRFVLSKGHASLALYATMALRGYLDPAELSTFGRIDSRLPGHPDMTKLPGVDISTGSLGLGMTAAVGMAIGAKLRRTPERVYTLLGDGECQEGAVWEAAQVAARYRLDNLCAIIDVNGLQELGWPGSAPDERLAPWPPERLAAAFEAFGWQALAVDGHDVQALEQTIGLARGIRGIPTVVIARTTKGKGVSFMEGQYRWHNRVPNPNELAIAIAELGEDGHR